MSTMTLKQVSRILRKAAEDAVNPQCRQKFKGAANTIDALLREREAAVTDEPRNEFPLLYDNLDALDERAAEQPNRIATARILTELRHQIGCVMTKLHGERAALKTVAPMLASARVPEGWQLVPVEPTVEMMRAGDDTGFHTYTGTWSITPDACWQAMLAAAPEARDGGVRDEDRRNRFRFRPPNQRRG